MTRRVPIVVKVPSHTPDTSQRRRRNRVLESGKKKHDEVNREPFEGVLVDALVAVEDEFLVVFLAFVGVCVKEREGHLGNLAVGCYSAAEEGDEEAGCDRDRDNLCILLGNERTMVRT